MAVMKATREEMETTIRFDGLRQEVHLYTAYAPMKRKIERKGARPYKVARNGGTETGWFYRIPYRAFRWSLKAQTAPVGPV